MSSVLQIGCEKPVLDYILLVQACNNTHLKEESRSFISVLCTTLYHYSLRKF